MQLCMLRYNMNLLIIGENTIHVFVIQHEKLARDVNEHALIRRKIESCKLNTHAQDHGNITRQSS